jgi:hypothetical protein
MQITVDDMEWIEPHVFANITWSVHRSTASIRDDRSLANQACGRQQLSAIYAADAGGSAG